jgi:hypothetical protein
MADRLHSPLTFEQARLALAFSAKKELCNHVLGRCKATWHLEGQLIARGYWGWSGFQVSFENGTKFFGSKAQNLWPVCDTEQVKHVRRNGHALDLKYFLPDLTLGIVISSLSAA